jgi:hypothetical protein
MSIHIKFSENQTTGSAGERGRHRGCGGLVSFLSTLRKESRLIKTGKLHEGEEEDRETTDYFMMAVMDCTG